MLSNYFKSHWSLAKLKLKDSIKYCAFADKNNFVGNGFKFRVWIVVSMNSKVYVYEIPEKGGYCALKTTHNIDLSDSLSLPN